MKKNKTIIISLLLAIFFTSCNEWLDVSPKTEIKSSDNFSSEQGFKDALTGVYLLMADGSLYGRELTFGMVDVLAQYYTGISQTTHSYYYPAEYAYDNDASISIINGIWGNMYNAIANDNELIANLEMADSTMFTGRNYSLIKGEAHALRAFLHFDVLRLFAPAYSVNPDAKAIPYIKDVSTYVTPMSTVAEVLEDALADLEIAESYLVKDPVIDANTESSTDDLTYERDRGYKFNYYAVKMLQARIYLYKGDYDAAYNAAKEVIDQSHFVWTPESEINTTDPNYRNYVFTEELVFALYDSDLSDSYTSYFTGKTGLYMLDKNYEGLFELNKSGYYGDYRYTYVTTLLANDNIRVSAKLKQPTNGSTAYLYRIPLMRISEAYYIAAECQLNDNNIPAALDFLTAVRIQRNLPDDLSETLSPDEVRDEIYKEYAKEFMCEGQLYYYFKRLNTTHIPIPAVTNGALTYSYEIPNYIFPLPDDEIEYGGRNNE